MMGLTYQHTKIKYIPHNIVAAIKHFLLSFLSTAIALQTSVVATQGLRVWTVYILKCPARRLQQLYGVPIVLKRTGIISCSVFVLYIAINQE